MNIKKLFAFFLCICMLSGCTAAEPAVSDGGDRSVWSVGFSKSKLLPDDLETADYYIAGYRSNNRASGLLDAQYARAAYISDNAGNNIVIAAVDCIGLSRSDIKKIRKRSEDVIKQYGLTAVHIMSTHTHAGIDTLGLWGPVAVTGISDKFMEILFEGTSHAIKLACENKRDGQLFYGYADTAGLQRDSRLPEITSPVLHRFRFVPADGSAGLQIINYGAHPEALRSENSKISADFPAYMGRKIAEKTGDEFIFIAGAIGGLISTNRQKDEEGNEYPVEQNVVITGEILADAALGIDNEQALKPSVSTRTEEFTINLDNQAYIAMAFLGIINARPLKGGGRYDLALETEVSLVTLGGINCALVPGELFPELAWGGNAGPLASNPGTENPPSLAEITGDDNLIVFGLANDEIGYIVTPNDFLLDENAPYLAEARDKNDRKHYEETNSVGIEAAVNLARALEKLMIQNK
ncbi:MAG: neutral/alkaline non-lysosomal ceramidase N-terminal domain-containing protein [Eubacteriales bacterium]